MNVEKTDRTPCVCMRMTARAGSWRRVVGLDLMAPGCVDRVPHDSRHSRARGKTSLCRVWRTNSGIRHQLKSSSYVTLQSYKYQAFISSIEKTPTNRNQLSIFIISDPCSVWKCDKKWKKVNTLSCSHNLRDVMLL